MMMPANFSAIAENELTYVVGGSAATDFAKTLNTNIVTIVGNTYVEKLINAALGTMFGGAWGDVSLTDTVSDAFFPDKFSGLNKVMSAVGLGAAVYQLGTASTGSVLSSKNKYKDYYLLDKDNNVLDSSPKVPHVFGVDGKLHSLISDAYGSAKNYFGL